MDNFGNYLVSSFLQSPILNPQSSPSSLYFHEVSTVTTTFPVKSSKQPQPVNIIAEDVNRMFATILQRLHNGTLSYSEEETRNGTVMRLGYGVSVLTYLKPTQRVLFNTLRDANPFFHLFESLWMLAGRNDLAPLLHYVSSFDKYSDNGVTLNGAYGYRWRNVNLFEYEEELDADILQEVDQLEIIAAHLKRDPQSRRAVLQMWNVQDDLMKIENSKDVCCNLCAVFEVQANKFLNMTVYNRSNDLIWGALGANAVHFSFLQEYLAHRIGVQVGIYSQVSSNLHIYKGLWDTKASKYLNRTTMHDYSYNMVSKVIPLVQDTKRFDEEVCAFVENQDYHCKERFLSVVAQPMCLAFRHHKERDYARALEAVSYIQADDWRHAAFNWITKREQSWVERNERTE